jgi:hypothetical protein
MTDKEINMALAKAIGWPRVWEHNFEVLVGLRTGDEGRVFDYTDPAVIWPIAKRYDTFPKPSYLRSTPWVAQFEVGAKPGWVGFIYETTAERASALAAIEYLRQK